MRRLALLSLVASAVQVLVVALTVTTALAGEGGARRLYLEILLPFALLGLGLVGWLSHRLHSAIARPMAQLQLAVESLDPESLERVELPQNSRAGFAGRVLQRHG